jgi:hypothetical protein
VAVAFEQFDREAFRKLPAKITHGRAMALVLVLVAAGCQRDRHLHRDIKITSQHRLSDSEAQHCALMNGHAAVKDLPEASDPKYIMCGDIVANRAENVQYVLNVLLDAEGEKAFNDPNKFAVPLLCTRTENRNELSCVFDGNR